MMIILHYTFASTFRLELLKVGPLLWEHRFFTFPSHIISAHAFSHEIFMGIVFEKWRALLLGFYSDQNAHISVSEDIRV